MADIGILGMGRMGRGIAEAYAFAGKSVLMIDVKPRSEADRQGRGRSKTGRHPDFLRRGSGNAGRQTGTVHLGLPALRARCRDGLDQFDNGS